MEHQSLKQLLSKNAFLSSQLSQIKKQVLSDSSFQESSQSSAVQMFEDSMAIRSAFCLLAEGIETHRDLAQLQKEQIQKNKAFMEGMQHFKTTLHEKTQQCSVDILALDDYLEQPLKQVQWEGDFKNQEELLLKQLSSKKSKKMHFQHKLKQKQQQQNLCNQRNDMYEKQMPQQVKKLQEQLLQTGKLFNIEPTQKISHISNSKLERIYDHLAPLQLSNDLVISYSQQNSFHQLEIVLTVKGGLLYKKAQAIKQTIAEKEIKFSIVTVEGFPHLVVGMDRREDFTTQEVFQDLINDQKVKEIFTSPQNQAQRNLNAKYCYLDWLETTLARGIIDAHLFVTLLRQRIFYLQMLANLKANFKSLSFYFRLGHKNESILALNPKKISNISFQSITFEEYISQVNVPSWAEKYVGIFKLSQNQEKQKKNQADFGEVLELLGLEQMDRGLNYYFKISLKNDSNKLTFVLIVPYSYPKRKSYIKILQLQTPRQDPQKNQLTIKCKHRSEKFLSNRFTDRMGYLETEINEKIDSFISDENEKSFRFLLQINRLLTLTAQQSKMT